MRYEEARQKDAYLRLPRLEANQLKILWCTNWYSGPEAGVLLFNGRKYRFESCALLEDETKRLLVIELSEGQLREEEYRIREYVEKVSSDSNYVYIDVGAKVIASDAKVAQEYYDACRNRERPDYSKNVVVGWFEYRKVEELCFGMENTPPWSKSTA